MELGVNRPTFILYACKETSAKISVRLDSNTEPSDKKDAKSVETAVRELKDIIKTYTDQ